MVNKRAEGWRNKDCDMALMLTMSHKTLTERTRTFIASNLHATVIVVVVLARERTGQSDSVEQPFPSPLVGLIRR